MYCNTTQLIVLTRPIKFRECPLYLILLLHLGHANEMSIQCCPLLEELLGEKQIYVPKILGLHFYDSKCNDKNTVEMLVMPYALTFL